MSSQYAISEQGEQEEEQEVRKHLEQLERYLKPLLVCLEGWIDHRLVKTFLETMVAIIRLRNRAQGLYLSELGGCLGDGKKAEAGRKRISRLLNKKTWGRWLIEEFLLKQADKRLGELEEQGEEVYCVWDGSVLEKPESEKNKALSVVRSSKGKRLRKRREGVWNPPGGRPIMVKGMEWIGLVVLGKQGPALIATMRWWSKKWTDQRRQERELLMKITGRWGKRVIHVFDRGYAGAPWLEMLNMCQGRFVTRWQKQYPCVDQEGREKKIWEAGRGKKTWGHKQMWNAKRKEWRTVGVVAVPIRHASYRGQLWLVIVRTKKEPWYLVTNERVETEEEAWRIVSIYTRRWQIEVVFRYGKSELGMESVRSSEWEASEKLLMMVTLVYCYLLWLLEEEQEERREWLLRNYSHRTGKRKKKTKFSLYRIRRAVSRLWNEHRLLVSRTLSAFLLALKECSKVPG